MTKNALRIKSLMILNRVSQDSVAKKTNRTQQAVSRVIHGKTTSARIRAEIAIRLGTTTAKLWPTKRRHAKTTV